MNSYINNISSYKIPQDRLTMFCDFYALSFCRKLCCTNSYDDFYHYEDLQNNVDDICKIVFDEIIVEFKRVLVFSCLSETIHCIERCFYRDDELYQYIYTKSHKQDIGINNLESPERITRYKKALSCFETEANAMLFARKVFGKCWEKQYGGESWLKIVNLYFRLTENNNLDNKMYLIDKVFDTYHNTGLVFDKLDSYGHHGIYDWIKEFLNFKSSISHGWYLYDCCSYDIKNVLSKVMKAYGYISFNTFLDNLDFSNDIDLTYIQQYNRQNTNKIFNYLYDQKLIADNTCVQKIKFNDSQIKKILQRKLVNEHYSIITTQNNNVENLNALYLKNGARSFCDYINANKYQSIRNVELFLSQKRIVLFPSSDYCDFDNKLFNDFMSKFTINFSSDFIKKNKKRIDLKLINWVYLSKHFFKECQEEELMRLLYTQQSDKIQNKVIQIAIKNNSKYLASRIISYQKMNEHNTNLLLDLIILNNWDLNVYYNISEKTFKKYVSSDKIAIGDYVINFSQKTLLKYKKYLGDYKYLIYKHLSEKEKIELRYKFTSVLSRYKIEEKILEKFIHIEAYKILSTQKLSEEFIKNHLNEMKDNVESLLCFQDLSFQFIKDNALYFIGCLDNNKYIRVFLKKKFPKEDFKSLIPK